MTDYDIKWSDIAFKSKKPLRDLNASFIALSREISPARFTQLVKEYLPSGNIILGYSNEKYIAGFENQPQFKTLRISTIKNIIDKVNNSASPHKITLLNYSQSEIVSIYDKVKFRRVILVNGSWQYSFHMRPEYYSLIKNKIPFEFVSPFVDESEAIEFANEFRFDFPKTGVILTENEIMQAANYVARSSFDSTFQTGVSLAKKRKGGYELIALSYNKVVPYQTFAWHFGPLRERHLSPSGDLNYYDTVHAEVKLLVDVQKSALNLEGTSLFINLLPCPTCARMLCETDISEIVYTLDHSNSYAIALLEKAGKTVRRLINTNELLKEG